MRVRKIAMVLTCLIIMVQLRASDAFSPVLDVPMLQSNKGHPVITVDFPDGQAVECVVDTGAMSGVAPAAILATQGDHAESLPEVSAQGANGFITVQRVRVSGLHLAGLELPPMTFVQRDLDGLTGPSRHTACVIGQPVLTPYAVEFDGVEQRFRLWPVDAVSSWSEAHDAVATQFSQPLAAFPMHETAWGAGTIRWVLDTGAPATSINRTALSVLGLASSAPIRTVERKGLDGAPQQQPVFAIPPIKLYQGLPEHAEVEVGDLPVLSALGVAPDQPGGLAGADLIDGQRLLIDYQSHRIWIAQSSSP